VYNEWYDISGATLYVIEHIHKPPFVGHYNPMQTFLEPFKRMSGVTAFRKNVKLNNFTK
jgi:hypothetical protein